MEPEAMDTDSERGKRFLSHPSSSSSVIRRRLESTEEAETAAVAGGQMAGETTLYMFLSLASGPIIHSLYAVRVPKLGDSRPTLVPCRDNVIYPVVELPDADYPSMMDCGKLGSKLYILGGEFCREDEEGYCGVEYPATVYSIDTAAISSSTSTMRPSELLVECNQMHSGKPKGRVFVVGGLLYAIATCCPPFELETPITTRFERFNPANGIWEKLPDPPFSSRIGSDVVVADGGKIVMHTSSGGVYCFDVNELTWIDIDMCCSHPSFEGHCIVLDDMVYSFYCNSLYAFGPTTSDDINSRVEGMFPMAAGVSTPLCEAILGHLSMEPSVYLDHWGNRVGCLAIVASLMGPAGHKYCQDSERGLMSVIVFEIPKKPFQPPPPMERIPRFEANVLHSAKFVFKSRHGADVSSPYLLGCFPSFTGME